MYTSTILFAIVASFASFVVATPPACLIAAVEMQSNPSNYKGICGSSAAMVGNLTESCSSGNKQAAINAYSSLCLAQGVTVSIASSTASSTNTGTAGSPTNTGGIVAATGTSSTPSSTSGAAAAASSKSASSNTTPQNAFFIAPILLGASFASQYLL